MHPALPAWRLPTSKLRTGWRQGKDVPSLLHVTGSPLALMDRFPLHSELGKCRNVDVLYHQQGLSGAGRHCAERALGPPWVPVGTPIGQGTSGAKTPKGAVRGTSPGHCLLNTPLSSASRHTTSASEQLESLRQHSQAQLRISSQRD